MFDSDHFQPTSAESFELLLRRDRRQYCSYQKFLIQSRNHILMIDTHCHIQTEQFDADREEVIAKASAAGVTHFIVPAIGKESFPSTLQIASTHENIY